MLQNYMINRQLLTTDEIDTINKRVDAEVQKAVDFAEAGTWEPVENLKKFVYYET